MIISEKINVYGIVNFIFRMNYLGLGERIGLLRKVVSGIVLMLLLTSTLSSASVIQPVKAEWTGTVYIRADGSIDPPDAPIQREGDVYTLTDNITSLGDGIVVERSNIIIDGNGYTLQGNKSGDGVCLSSVSNVTIKNTNIKDFYSTKPFVFYYGIYLHESSNNRIFENNLVNNDVGIYLDFSSNNELFRNKILESNLYGIESYRSSNNHIFGNNVTKSWIAGIRLESSLNNEVFGNNIAHNDEDGIELKSADNNSVFENNITANNCYGISIWLSSNNSVFRNDITSNSKEMGGTGINLDGSSYNRLYQNNIANNDWGIYFYYSLYNRVFRNNITTNYHGVYFDSSSLNNSVYHNNFVSNPAHSECVNVWDNGYPFGGNYWSDYTGVDLFSGSYQNLTGSDGIGDTSYVIDENNTDRYPLMGPFSSFNTSVGYFVDVISKRIEIFLVWIIENRPVRFNVFINVYRNKIIERETARVFRCRKNNSSIFTRGSPLIIDKQHLPFVSIDLREWREQFACD